MRHLDWVQRVLLIVAWIAAVTSLLALEWRLAGPWFVVATLLHEINWLKGRNRPTT